MELQFDHAQAHQTDAVDAVVHALAGGLRTTPQPAFQLGVDLPPAPNAYLLPSEQRLATNLRETSTASKLPFAGLAAPIAFDDVSFHNLSVEMETGTGKTYTYLRTLYALAATYGLTKFICVVPSIAIRENVLKSADQLENDLRQLYPSVSLHTFAYQTGKVAPVRRFVRSSTPQLLVLTLSAFNKDSNLLQRRGSDAARSGDLSLVEAIAACRPVLILDEPQNMESETSRKALAQLNPLVALRYSATHRDPYNLVYRLTPVEAYRRHLVKGIEVWAHSATEHGVHPWMELQEVATRKSGGPAAKVKCHAYTASGGHQRSTKSIDNGKNAVLGDVTRNPLYQDYVVKSVSTRGGGSVEFTNGHRLTIGMTEQQREPMFRAMIRSAVQAHFERQLDAATHDVKVLTLFFVDKVANVVGAGGGDGLLVQIFEDEYERYVAANRAALEAVGLQVAPAEDVRKWYFATTQDGQARDTSENDDKNTGAFDLIMRGKERLLSFDEPTAFLFSHSALREGWDNPNVFVIATLNEAQSLMRKRQEVGRGVRLCVDQRGQRVADEALNTLTVIANQDYGSYVETLQRELEDDGYSTEAARAAKGRVRQRAQRKRRRRTAAVDAAAFKELWVRIARRTSYRVTLDSAEVIDRCVESLMRRPIHTEGLGIARTIARVELATNEGGAVAEGVVVEDATVTAASTRKAPVGDVVGLVADEVGLTRSTVAAVIRQSGGASALLANPDAYAMSLVGRLHEALRQLLVDGVVYEPVQAADGQPAYVMHLGDLDVEIAPPPKDAAEADPSRSPHEVVQVESDPERDFAGGLKNQRFVLHYAKLPRKFAIETPFGTYNPDWAVLAVRPDGSHTLHLVPGDEPAAFRGVSVVAETKSTTDEDELRGVENLKNECGRRHFAALGDDVAYEVVTNIAELKRAVERHLAGGGGSIPLVEYTGNDPDTSFCSPSRAP